MSSAQADRLESLLKANTAADRAEIRAAISRLSTDVREKVRRGSATSYDFFVSAVRALSKIKGCNDADLRLECLIQCIEYFYVGSHESKALEAARQLVSLAALTGDASWIRKGHSYIGAIYADQGHVGEALVHFARALDLSRQLGDVVAQSRVLCNIGVAMNYGGLYREAIPSLVRAAELAASLPDANLRAACLTNLAQSYLYLEQFQNGFEGAEMALAMTPDPKGSSDVVSYVIRGVTLVQHALEVGKLSLARSVTADCVQRARSVDSPRAQTMAQLARGLCEVHGGTSLRGVEILEDALERTTVQACRPLLHISLVRAYDATGQPERALAHMRSLLDCVKTARKIAIEALLAEGVGEESTSLQALELKEARLQARIAERQIGVERLQMLERLAVTADLREEESGEHGYRVGRLAGLIGTRLNWSPGTADTLEFAARLHDIGKVAIPDRLLLTSKELQEAERHFIASHATIGAELLSRGNSPQLRMAEEIARYHHEWWNGEGYPSKLKGKRIPIHARIVAIADVFDALTHGRPFSPPWPIDKALDEIRARKGTQFDPEITDVFLDLIAKLRVEQPDLDEYLGRAGRNSPFLQARNRIRQMLAEEREHEKMATVEGNDTRH